MQKIAKGVYVETGFRGCNVGFIDTGVGIVMIETPMVPSEAVKWRDEIARYGEVSYLINNEPHYDHISGDCFFGGALIAHEGTREGILKSSVRELEDRLKMAAPDNIPLPDDFRFRLPDITLNQNLNIYLGSHTFELMHLPGHSPSQLAVYVPRERVVFTSDNVVNPGPPYLHQALPYQWLESLKKIQQLDVDWIVPGHGSICDRSYLPKMMATIQNWIDKITDTKKKGLSVEEAQNKLSISELFPNIPMDDRLQMIKQMNIAHLYEVLK